MSSQERVNTNLMFNTVYHDHLDVLVNQYTDRFPESALLIVECADGRWFLEVNFGNEFNSLEGISRPNVLPYEPPTFFEVEKDARIFAVECIKKVHKELVNIDFQEFIETGE